MQSLDLTESGAWLSKGVCFVCQFSSLMLTLQYIRAWLFVECIFTSSLGSLIASAA